MERGSSMKDEGSPMNVFSKSVSKDSSKDGSKEKGNAATIKIDPTMTSSDLNFGEARNTIEKIKTIKSEIDEMVDKVVSKSGFTKEQIWSYLENQTNFSPEQWAQFQDNYKQLADRVWSSIAVTSVDLQVNATPSNSVQKGHRTKSSGARRNWMSTR